MKPVTCGTREVLVLELWIGETRVCPHRCLTHHGLCPDFPPARPQGSTADKLGRGKKRARDSRSVRAMETAHSGHRSALQSGAVHGGVGGKATATAAPGTIEGSAAHLVLECMHEQAQDVLADTGFAGWAFYPRIAQLQGRGRPNVEISFEGGAPIATVRAHRAISLGDRLSTG